MSTTHDTPTLESLADRISQLEAELEAERDAREELEERVADLETENQILRSRVDGLHTTTDKTEARLNELQARELEKGAHLRKEHVYPWTDDLDVATGRLETFEKDHGTFMRIPDADDTLNRGGATQLAEQDLLPIQQLARLDDDMLRGTVDNLPSRLAAKAWAERHEDTGLWQHGSGDVREYIDASDLRHWIRREESGISEAYAKKLVSRTIDALQEYTHHRLTVMKRRRRKDGLQYKERRIVLRSDVEVPGETTQRQQ
ncbi:hypothetical protein GCM10009037_30640 [Halarchaeum grantii]|uniref:Uncharacterized protein n=1 Tax=Halarchaeum grantii TaxID=1193105 RepID=A0A830EZC3_9EURY|nr:hypothetical protein [Halarchaeum grantii]GGL45116.1 hypothetical protein GCM10009037_30640 [Halarchaeum grantii]